MRIYIILELLLIFILLAFASSKTIPGRSPHRQRQSPTDPPLPVQPPAPSSSLSIPPNAPQASPDASPIPTVAPAEATAPVNPSRYCSCNTVLCNCCRNFFVPVLGLRGPGCASLQYLQGDKMAIAMSFGDRVVSNTTVSGRRPSPVCMPLPGGISRFCGRVYNIRRKNDNFQACLGLELRALADLEASVRVSCFRFGPEGVKIEPAEPLPIVDDDDDDDDDDDFDLDDDDDDDDDDDGIDFDDDDDDDDDDIVETPFSVFREDFFDDLFDEDTNSRPVTKKIISTTTTRKPVRKIVRRPVANKIKRVTVKPSTLAPVKVTKRKTIASTTTQKPVRTTTRTIKTTTRPIKTTTSKPLRTTTKPSTTVKSTTTKKIKLRRKPTTARTTTTTPQPTTVTTTTTTTPKPKTTITTTQTPTTNIVVKNTESPIQRISIIPVQQQSTTLETIATTLPPVYTAPEHVTIVEKIIEQPQTTLPPVQDEPTTTIRQEMTSFNDDIIQTTTMNILQDLLTTLVQNSETTENIEDNMIPVNEEMIKEENMQNDELINIINPSIQEEQTEIQNDEFTENIILNEAKTEDPEINFIPVNSINEEIIQNFDLNENTSQKMLETTVTEMFEATETNSIKSVTETQPAEEFTENSENTTENML